MARFRKAPFQTAAAAEAIPQESIFWFGAYPNQGSRFSFVGCTVAPGFDFTDFEMGDRTGLINQFPHAKDLIERLTDN